MPFRTISGKCGALNEFQPLLSGFERHVSGMQKYNQEVHTKKKALREQSLRSIKPTIDMSMPKFHEQFSQVKSSRQVNTLRQQTEIEKENYKLLEGMKKIFNRGEEESIHAGMSQRVDALNNAHFSRAREKIKKMREIEVENRMIEQHITEQKPHYTSKEFKDHSLKTFKQIEFSRKYTDKVCKVLPLKKPPRTRTPSSEPPPPSSSQTTRLPRIASSCFGTNNLPSDQAARIRTSETRREMIQVSVYLLY
jgi:hypothetical protein